MAEKVENELIEKGLLEESSKIELSRFDTEIINFEKSKKQKVNGAIYNLCKMGFDAVERNQTTWEHLINLLEESRCV